MSENYVYDSSVILAIIGNEKGGELASQRVNQAIVSTVNYTEVIAKLVDRGYQAEIISDLLEKLDLPVVGFDKEQSIKAGLLRATTRIKGLSLGDRACLALAHTTGRIALTADRAWTDLDVGVVVELIR